MIERVGSEVEEDMGDELQMHMLDIHGYAATVMDWHASATGVRLVYKGCIRDLLS